MAKCEKIESDKRERKNKIECVLCKIDLLHKNKRKKENINGLYLYYNNSDLNEIFTKEND